MLLSKEKSLCEDHQKIIVSKDQGTARKHRATNENGKYQVRHYRLDGDIVKQTKCCDFLLLNDSKKEAYFIELKGSNLDEAVPQFRAAEKLCRSELQGYIIQYRIVCSKVRTHKVQGNTFRKFYAEVGKSLKYQSVQMSDVL